MVSSINQMRDTPLLRKGVNKVALRLFEHNEKAYHAAVRMMNQYGKAAIVHPNGTGKSYIAFKLIEDNSEKVVIWLSPSEYIFKTQLESLKRNDPDFPLANVHFYTYAKLMCCTQAQLDEIAAQKPAYIILDEFHRAGAECWGESTVDLLKLCPAAKLLGQWVTSQQWANPKGKLTDEQVERLNRIGMYWGNRNDRQWNEGYQEAKRYFEAYGNLNVPADYVSPGGYNLGNWVKRQRYTRQNPEKSCAVLTEERIAKLDEIGMRWEKSNPKRSSRQAVQAETVTAKAG